MIALRHILELTTSCFGGAFRFVQVHVLYHGRAGVGLRMSNVVLVNRYLEGWETEDELEKEEGPKEGLQGETYCQSKQRLLCNIVRGAGLKGISFFSKSGGALYTYNICSLPWDRPPQKKRI